MATLSTPAMGNLVDLERGRVSRKIYTDDELYRHELEQVFARAWLFVGHESQVSNPDDFFVSRMGEESVILTRDRQGELHVLLNTCRHRGMKVCRYDEGNTSVFSCPYHGWSYSTNGKLVSVPGELIGVPQFKTAYHGELKKEEWGLVYAPQMVNYRGSIWATWDKDAPSFEDYMGDQLMFWNGTLDGADGTPASVEVIGVQKFIIPGNWKYGAENFIGDNYHATTTHQSVNLVGISPTGQGRGSARRVGLGRTFGRGNVSFPALGHGGLGATQELSGFEYPESWPGMPMVEEYYREAHERRQKRLADGEVRWRYFTSTTFPNTSTHSDPHAIFVWHPSGPRKTELWRWFLVDKDAPKEAKDAQRHFALRYAGPAGMTEQDDAEAWSYATEASKGVIAGRHPFAYEMSLGYELPAEGLRGAYYTETTSEHNQRTLYKRWAEFMDGQSWAELMPDREA